MISTTDTERAILGCLVVHGRKALMMAPDLSTRNFAIGAHRDAFAAIAKIDQDDADVNLSTLAAELVGKVKAADLSDWCDHGVNLNQIRGTVRQLLIAQAVVKAGTIGRKVTLIAESQEGTALLGERLEELSRLGVEIAKLVSTKATDESALISIAEVAEQEIARLERIFFGEEQPQSITTGIEALDKRIYIQPGQLVIVGGVTGSGKSAFCGHLTVHAASKGDAVVYVTAEMMHRQMLGRIAANAKGLSVRLLANPHSAIEMNAQEAYRELAKLPIDFQRRFPPTVEDAMAAIREAVIKRGAKLAVIDYLQRMTASDFDDRHERLIARIAHESKNLALELGIVVVAAAQVNREVTKRQDPRPQLSDLRWSGEIEQNADCVLFVYRPELHGKQGATEIIVAKQRDGPLGPVDVVFDPESCSFRG